MNVKFFFFIVGLTVSGAQAASVYVCHTAHGTIYTSKPNGHCQTAELPPIGRYTSAPYASASEKPSSTVRQATAAKKTPSVKNKTVKRANNRSASPPVVAQPKASSISGRMAILQQELANERRALASERQAFTRAQTASPNDKELLGRLKEGILDRQANIQALQRELSRM